MELSPEIPTEHTVARESHPPELVAPCEEVQAATGLVDVQLRLLVKFPHGAAVPCLASPSEAVEDFKLRILTAAGVPASQAPNFGLALGLEGLPEARAVRSTDLQDGDTVSLFLRSKEPKEKELEQEMLWR